ncbi:putative cytoplasmic protein [Salmonella enterica subsp. enterica serovar Heidelberg]|nr:putative cytoplasmic protein [Salmonella enterica subsp. enterica serovar Heidelberg]
MNVSMQARLVGNDRYLFVNTQRANPSIKTVSRFFEYKTWTEQIWRTEIIENGNAFFSLARTRQKKRTSGYHY